MVLKVLMELNEVVDNFMDFQINEDRQEGVNQIMEEVVVVVMGNSRRFMYEIIEEGKA